MPEPGVARLSRQAGKIPGGLGHVECFRTFLEVSDASFLQNNATNGLEVKPKFDISSNFLPAGHLGPFVVVAAVVILTTIVLPQSSRFKSAKPPESLCVLQEMRFGFERLFHQHKDAFKVRVGWISP